MTTITTHPSIHKPSQPDMSTLKRKSLSGSATPEGTHGGAPNKRAKVNDSADSGAEPEVKMEQDVNKSIEQEDAKQAEASGEDIAVKAEILSPSTRQPAESDMTSLSPRQDRQPSESRRRDSSSHTRSPDQDRESNEAQRRSRSPVRSSNHDRPLGGDRRRDSSPHRQDRRGSETSRRDSGSNQTYGDKDRSWRGAVNKEEEKKRGKRLFGGLLSTLSQTSTNSQQKRRQEIEKRQQEKAAKQKSEDDARRSDRLTILDRVRKIEQVRFDEQVMRTRHSNILAGARGLQTKSEPKLYYRPWAPTKEQEDIIKDQIRDAEVQIDDELQQFKRDKAHRLRELGALPPHSLDADASVDEPVEGDRLNNAAQDESAATATNDRKEPPTPTPVTEDKDQGEMVEAEEDTVIY